MPLLLDHMGYPNLDEPPEAFQPIVELASFDNVAVKISDVHGRSKQAFPYADVHPFIQRLHHAFGAERMLWGTGYPGHHRTKHNWPTLAEELRLVQEGFDFLSPREKDQMLGEYGRPHLGTDLIFASLLHTQSTRETRMTLDTSDQNIYQAIGVEPIINCRGTFTIIGGSVELPEVVAAMEAASGYFVQYDELAEAVGQRLADITGAEWGLIPAGCAAGLKHITAACVTGGNPEKLIRIPDLTGLDKTQVIIPRYSRNAYDHALRSIGVEIVMVETRDELEQAINPRTAMIYITTGAGSATDQPLSLEVIADVARPHKIPILADSAAENLTIPNVHLQRGATVVAYSGGKALCGPQCAGLVLGDKALLQSAWQFSSPHHGPGRDDKIGKEEIMGMLAAVEAWVRRDHAAEWQTWLSYLDHIAQRVRGIDSVSTEVNEPTGLSNRAPDPHHQLGPCRLAHYRRRGRRGFRPQQTPHCRGQRRCQRPHFHRHHAQPDAAGQRPSGRRPNPPHFIGATESSIDGASPSGNRRQRFLGSHHQLFEQQQPAPAIPRTGGALDRRHPYK